MSWYYNRNSGLIVELTGWEKWGMDREITLEKGAAALGVPETNFGPFATKAEAQAFKTSNPSLPDVASKAVTGLDLGSVVNNITHNAEQLAIRAFEAAVGIVLLAIALNVILKQATGKDIGIAGPSRIKQGAKLVATKGLVK